MRAPLPRWQPYAHIVALTGLVVAHPILDLVARFPELLVARDLGFAEALGLALILVAGLPLPLLILRGLLARASDRLAGLFDLGFLWLAGLLLILQMTRASLGAFASGYLALALAVAGATFGCSLYRRSRATRTFLSLLTPVPLAALLLFLLHPGIARLNDPAPAAPTRSVALTSTPPIVFINFDALSVAAVMDDNGRVNARRFPHLAALADDAFFFTNAAAAGRVTNDAIPPILTGRFVKDEKLARLADHPHNLFTVLAETYRIFAAERIASLCPPGLNLYPRETGPADASWRSGVVDLGLIFLHRTLPEPMAARLPRVDDDWRGFGRPDAAEVERFDRFLATLATDVRANSADSTLYYLHLVFPHRPHLFLPSGKMFRRSVSRFPRMVAEDGNVDEESQIFLYKRYLLQAGYVDPLIGRLTSLLRDLAIYERSIIVVTSDHGTPLQPLALAPGDALFVPLLIKPAGPTRGEIRAQPTSTVDLLPTLVDLLGGEVPWQTDGRSLFDPSYIPPERYFDGGAVRPITPAMRASRPALIRWKLEQFGNGEDPTSLYRAGGPRPDLLDRRPDDLDLHAGHPIAAKLDIGPASFDLDPADTLVPAHITGRLVADARRDAWIVAVSINGTIEATATARFHAPSGTYPFRVMVPEPVFHPGRNRIGIWVVDPETPARLIRVEVPGPGPT